MARLVALPLVALVIALPAAASAQSSWGAPAEGVQVQSRFTSPGQSQAILTAAPPAAAPTAAAPAAAPGAPGAPTADAGPQLFVNDRVTNEEPQSYLEEGDTEKPDLPASLIYQGVVPGRTPGANGTGKRNALNWVGFQPLERSTRVFIRTDHEAPYEVIAAPDGLSVTVRLKVPAIAHRNLSRTIDASAFGREVASIDTSRGPNGTTDVIISLLSAARFVTDAHDGYLYIDFAR